MTLQLAAQNDKSGKAFQPFSAYQSKQKNKQAPLVLIKLPAKLDMRPGFATELMAIHTDSRSKQ